MTPKLWPRSDDGLSTEARTRMAEAWNDLRERVRAEEARLVAIHRPSADPGRDYHDADSTPPEVGAPSYEVLPSPSAR
jgi:hypothetical protein